MSQSLCRRTTGRPSVNPDRSLRRLLLLLLLQLNARRRRVKQIASVLSSASPGCGQLQPLLLRLARRVARVFDSFRFHRPVRTID